MNENPTAIIVDETFTDPRDGKTYKTVKIGGQIWMAENLNYECEGSQYYRDDPERGKKYGRLYDWEAARKACPPGWHLPSKEEWETLVNSAGGTEIAGKYLKAAIGWGSSGNGTDDYGFSALPGGGAQKSSSIENFYVCECAGEEGLWWSISEDYDDVYSNKAYFRHMHRNRDGVYWEYANQSDRLSVRCIHNSSVQSSSVQSSSGGGCYIATCVYGSYDCPEVWTLRQFRDNELSNLWLGRQFIRIYYAISPKIVELFGDKKWFSKLWKPIIDKIVRKLQRNG